MFTITKETSVNNMLGKKDQNYESLVPNSHSQALVLELELERNCLLQFP